MRNKTIKLLFLIFLLSTTAKQSYCQDETKTSTKYITWALLQTIPSPVFIQDSDGKNARVQFGLRWQVIPLNISFRSNKYMSPAQFFMINPVRKFTGSIELFLQPEWSLASFKYSGYDKFGLAAGSRITFPIKGDGEIFSGSIGGKYTLRNNSIDDTKGYYGIEAGVYAIYGIIGLQFNYNFKSNTKYNIGLYFKYF